MEQLQGSVQDYLEQNPGAMAAILALWMGVVGWAVVRELNSSGGEFTKETVGYLEQNNS